MANIKFNTKPQQPHLTLTCVCVCAAVSVNSVFKLIGFTILGQFSRSLKKNIVILVKATCFYRKYQQLNKNVMLLNSLVTDLKSATQTIDMIL